ncbi:pyruvate kinase isoform X2 [Lepeophtheirus salmonis]|uniref:pyruvate kinase isoform X2 n=1 Tax=Lepeophtheirus salmonis TaxID=72036 RepID=UPI001AE11C46|nr:pyruvate kinase-like isoform X2 [Lepeophtheirus salmonis]
MSAENYYSILPKSNIPSGQSNAAQHAINRVDYNTRLDIMSQSSNVRHTGIVCTIGPTSREVDFLVKMLEAGMNIARMNFSHGTHKYHAETIANCRKAAQIYEEKTGFNPNLAIALDTKGPEVRTGILEGDDGRKEVTLQTGNKIIITTDDSKMDKCTADLLYVDYKNIGKVVEPGKKMYIDDGLISVVVEEVKSDHIVGKIENGGALGSKKGCNLPGTTTDLPAVSDKDKEDLRFGVEHNVDMVFASFIRDASGVNSIREVLGKEGEEIKIISKIENQEGCNNIDEIIGAGDGIMVARGDMGIEIPPEKVFIAQKQIIAKCNKAGKPVICATQMLESMTKKPRPTRAEGSDVANAILDGADCVMLSGETAKGDYPLECVRTMSSIAKEAESVVWNQRFFEQLMASESKTLHDCTETTSVSAVHASYLIRASAIIIITTSGFTANHASKYRPVCPIIAITRDAAVARKLHLYRGVIPIYYALERDTDWTKDTDNRIQKAITYGKNNNFIKTGDNIICVTGWRQGTGSSNCVRIINVD